MHEFDLMAMEKPHRASRSLPRASLPGVWSFTLSPARAQESNSFVRNASKFLSLGVYVFLSLNRKVTFTRITQITAKASLVSDPLQP